MEPVFKVCKLYSVFWYKISYATLTMLATVFNKFSRVYQIIKTYLLQFHFTIFEAKINWTRREKGQ